MHLVPQTLIRGLGVALLCALLAPAHAALVADANNEYAGGTISAQDSDGYTLACWVLKADWDSASVGAALALSANAGSFDNSLAIWHANTDIGLAREADGTFAVGDAQVSITANSADGVWVALIGIFTSSTSRTVRINNTTGTPDTTSIDAGAALDVITIGNTAVRTVNDIAGSVEDCAAWSTPLSSGDQQDFADGDCPSTISSGSLVEYWPLTSNGTGAVNGINVTASGGATFDSNDGKVVGSCGGGAGVMSLLQQVLNEAPVGDGL